MKRLVDVLIIMILGCVLTVFENIGDPIVANGSEVIDTGILLLRFVNNLFNLLLVYVLLVYFSEVSMKAFNKANVYLKIKNFIAKFIVLFIVSRTSMLMLLMQYEYLWNPKTILIIYVLLLVLLLIALEMVGRKNDKFDYRSLFPIYIPFSFFLLIDWFVLNLGNFK